MLLPADQQVGHVGVWLIVNERAAIDAAGMKTMRQRHSGRGTAVPLILPAGVQVDVSLAEDHRHGLGPRAAHGHKFRAEYLGYCHSFAGRPRPAYHHAQSFRRRRHCNRRICTQDKSPAAIRAGQGNCPKHWRSVDCQPDMDRPVLARLAIFARAIDRVDDPGGPSMPPAKK